MHIIWEIRPHRQKVHVPTYTVPILPFSPSITADIATLKQGLKVITDTMRQTGVGALPLLPAGSTAAPSEQQMIHDTGRAVQALYEKLKRSQESAAVVANLLGAPEAGASATGRGTK